MQENISNFDKHKYHVIMQTAFLGDLLLCIPLIKQIRKKWPQDKILLVCRQGLGDFFIRTRLVDHIAEIKKGDRRSYKAVLKNLKSLQIINIFSPHQSLRTALFAAKLNSKNKIGFRSWWNRFLFSNRVRFDKSLPDALRQLSLMTPFDQQLSELYNSYLSKETPNLPNPNGELPAPPIWALMDVEVSESSNLNKGLSIAPPLSSEQIWEAPDVESDYYLLLKRLQLTTQILEKSVFIFPGSVWATKRWTLQGFQEVGRGLAEAGYNVLVLGGPGEEELCARVAREIHGARNLAGLTGIFESFLLLRKGLLVIGNDSASGHLASCANRPIVGIFGPTILGFGYRPWARKVVIIEENNLKCRPCGKHGHRRCPIKTHECMVHISVSRVLEVSLRLLQR